MNITNLFENIPESLGEEHFETILDSQHVTVERIVSSGHTSPATGWYDQEKNEWVVVLKGRAVISFADDPDVRLGKGDCLTIPAHRKHRVSWTDPETETIWLAIHY